VPGLTLYLSNRLENLADRLAEMVRAPVGAPLQPETIVVQSRGMQRWITMELARRNGISANAHFPFPNTFLDGVYRRLFPDLPETSPFEPDMLTAQIMKALPGLSELPEFASLRHYLQDDPSRLKLYQLSDRIAATFDQYMVFRPQMILAWEKQAERCEPENRWQPLLWREIVRNSVHSHRARLQKELLHHLQIRPEAEPLLSERIHIFGISYLPPFHLQVFAAMARAAQVNLFLLNPCREYWADILDTRDIQRLTRQYTIGEETEAYYYLDRGNPLLASMGTLGRDFLSLVSDTDCQILDGFTEVEGRDLLTAVQSDILNLVDRTASEPAGTFQNSESAPVDATAPRRSELSGRDESIQIHACHSPIREIEVLYDRLLAMFDGHSDLKPRDVIVMTPDIESYAPFIDAVFGTQLDSSQTIPYSIADQSARFSSPVVDAFLQLLALKGSRFSVSQIGSVMELPGVKERFGWTQPELEQIFKWIDDVGIRWGRDAQSRSLLGLPPLTANTWKEGLQRLLLGLAMPDEQQVLFAGIRPYDPIEGQDGQVLGKLLDFLQQVFRLADLLCQPCRPLQWQERLNEMLEQFFLFSERSERDLHQIRQALTNLSRMETIGGYDRELSVEVVAAQLEKSLVRSPHASGFLSGGVTFCAMLPMRSIPFQVVCLVGMNNEAIPRNQRPLGFDLIHRHPQPGDRSRRNDDKYLFLESILSARRTLYISYVGQSVEDNSRKPPSVLVSELVDYLGRGFGIAEDAIVVRHPLQPFSPRCFESDRPALLSYSRENFEAVRNRRLPRDPEAFFSDPLPQPPPQHKTLTVEQLGLFFQQPVRYLLQQRLSLRVEEGAVDELDHEPFRLEALARHQIGQKLVERGLSGFDLAADFDLQKATGRLPQGTVGESAYREIQLQAEGFIRKVRSEVRDQPSQHQPVDLHIADFSLHGVLTDLYPQGRIQCRFARMKARDVLSAWIGHLCLGLLTEEPLPFRSTLLTADAILRFTSVRQPDVILEELLRIYWRGLQEPLHFFPELSLQFFREVFQKKRKPADAVRMVRKRWAGDEYARGQLDDPYVRICFERTDPLDQSFQELAEAVFRPILRHATDEGGKKRI
jgi:exodeoxyribonuclease V gamma subunit